MQSHDIKSMKAAKLEHNLHYNIKPDSPITLNHILSVLFYTDMTSLSTTFSSTFRSLHSDDTLDDIFRRNQEYYHWSKLIRETVQIFGTAVGIKKRDAFYTGISYMTVPSFVIRLCAPTSTTKQFEVAMNFSTENGIIMQINNGSIVHSQYLRYFDCSWLSCFNEEDERLFCGGNYPLRVESVTLVATRQNFYLFFKSLFYLDCMLSGIWLSDREKCNVKRSDYKILKAMIDHKLSIKKNKYLDYINNTFISFCHHKRQIVINLEFISKYFLLLKNIIFEMDDNIYMLNMNLISKLFVNCKKLIIIDTSGKYEFELAKFMSLVMDVIQKKQIDLDEIEVKVRRRSNDENSWLHWEYNSNDFQNKLNELNDKYELKLYRQRCGDGSFDVMSVCCNSNFLN